MSLPIEPFLGEIRRRLREEGRLLLSAAPGAGKTTCVPGALAEEFPRGRILMVEPRRVAATSAAYRISELGNGEPGAAAGYIVRGERCVGGETRIIVMTPGVLLRKLQADPALEDTSAVIFDEFHERSAECDLLFALILETLQTLREDLKLVIMSATLDSGRLKEMLRVKEAFHIPGREFPVEQFWSEELCPRERIPEEMARAVLTMAGRSEGNLLAFFPGVGEIRKCAGLLAPVLPECFLLQELHGSLPLREQARVLKAAPDGRRKVVLCTNVAESSLTVADVRCVVDSGYERVPRYDPGSGLTFLETVPVSRASAAQRSGRAGRTAPGTALRLWNKESHRGRREFSQPEILECELSSLVLETALWGTGPRKLQWLTPPPEGAVREALALLQSLGALDREGRPTARGRALARFPVHPRLGAMLLAGQELKTPETAVLLAALLENRSDGSFPPTADVEVLAAFLRNNLKSYPGHRLVVDQLREIMGVTGASAAMDTERCGELLLAAFPERAAKLRRAGGSSYTLKNGRGGKLADDDPLRGSEFLAVAELGGRGSGDGVILKAARLSKETLLRGRGEEITRKRLCALEDKSGRVLVRECVCFGEILLSETPVPPEPGEAAKAVLAAAADRGINLIPPDDKSGTQLWARLSFACRAEPENFPEWSRERLVEEAWPLLPELKTLAQLGKIGWGPILKHLAGRRVMAELDRLYPAGFRTPAGAEHLIDYSGEAPLLRVRLQEMLGVKQHPFIGVKRIPLRIELLSPAMRPIQTTSDLPGFWAGSYALVRKEMKARYPKHEWPENPAESAPMLRSVKKR